MTPRVERNTFLKQVWQVRNDQAKLARILANGISRELAKERGRVRRIVRSKYPSIDLDDYRRGYSKALTDVLAALRGSRGRPSRSRKSPDGSHPSKLGCTTAHSGGKGKR